MKIFISRKALLLTLLISFSYVFYVSAQVFEPFTARLPDGGISLKGDITFISNSIVSLNQSGFTPNDDYDGFRSNNQSVLGYIDIDSDPTTFSSSRSSLNLPSCSQIVYAGLYWSAVYPQENWSSSNPRDNNFNTIKFRLPNQNYQDITADEIIFDDLSNPTTSQRGVYTVYKDVTSIVSSQSNPNGDYFAANIRATVGGPSGIGSSAGWIMVVIYQNESEPTRRISIFDGFTAVSNLFPSEIVTYSGFNAVPNGPVRAKMLVAALEGDRSISGDQFQFRDTGGNFQTLSTPNTNPNDNFFNGSITLNDQYLTGREPASENTLGFDADLFEIDNTGNLLIANNQTSADTRFTSQGDAYWPFLNAMSIEVIEPDIQLVNLVEDGSGSDISGQTVTLGDDVIYNLRFQNVGNDDALGTQIIFPIPRNLNFDPNTGLVLPSGVTYSYEEPSDANNYTGELTFDVESSLVEASGSEHEILIRTNVQANCNDIRDLCSSEISSQAFIRFQGNTNGTIYDDQSSFSGLDSCGIGIEETTDVLIDTSGCTDFQPEISYECDTGLAIITIIPTRPNLTYSIDGGASYQASNSFTGLNVGSYNIIVNIDDNCTEQIPVNINSTITPLEVNLVGLDVTTIGGNDGSIDGTITGGVEPYIVSWDTVVSTEEDLADLVAGTYTITVTDNNNCTVQESVTIAEPLQANASESSPVLCFGEATGEAIASATGGIEPYTYLWSDGQTTATATGLSAGNYTVTITDSNGREDTASVTISEPAAALEFDNIAITDVLCFGDQTGSIDIAVSGGTGTYTYSWTGPNGYTSTSEDVTAVFAGVYEVTVIDANNCTVTESITISESSAPLTIDNTNITDVLCFGDQTGSIDIAVSGGTGLYTYSWTGPNGYSSISEDITGVFAGVYEVTIIDANNCTVTESITINEPSAVLSASANLTQDYTCTTLGVISITDATGGSGDYTFILNSIEQATGEFTGLIPGNYTPIIRDSNGCELELDDIEIESLPSTPDITTTINYNCDGSADISIFPQDPSYTYTLGNLTQTNNLFEDIQPGIYTISLDYGTSCPAEYTVTVLDNQDFNGTLSKLNDISCAGESDGRIEFTVTNFGSNYEYSMDNGISWIPSTSATVQFENLAQGSYEVLIRKDECTVDLGEIQIIEPTIISISEQINDVTCFGGSDGEIQLNASGGTAPYTYLWNNNQTTANLVDLAAGIYSVTVTDNNGCSISANFEVTQPELVETQVQDVTCNGGVNGEAIAIVNSCQSGYTFLWSDGQITQDATGLSAGTYWVEVTDSSGNTNRIEDIVVNEPPAIQLSLNVSNITCNGVNDGQVTVNPSNGVLPYTYAWSDGQTTQTATNLSPDTYQVTVTDANGCAATTQVVISEPEQIVLSTNVINNNCLASGGCEAIVIPSGGVGGYSYLWSDGQTTQIASGLSQGVYQVTVTDVNGCSETVMVNIGVSTAVTNVSCYGSSDGTASVIVPGDSSSYTYQWSDGQITQTATGLSAGQYTVDVTDATGTTSLLVTITEPAELQLSLTSTNESALGSNDGQASVTVNQGVAPFSYIWSDGQTTSTAVGLTEGTYQVTVTDANGCSSQGAAVIISPEGFGISSTTEDVSCFGGNDGRASVSIFGGIAPYNYLWSDGQTTRTAVGLIAGNYSVTVTDIQGETETLTNIIIEEPNELTLASISLDVTCFRARNGEATVAVSGGTAPYTYVWSDGQRNSTATGLAGGTYSVTVSDKNGCSTTLNGIVINEPNRINLAFNKTDNFCNGENQGEISLNVSGGTAPFSFLWSDGQTTQNATNLKAGTYSVTVTDSNGCYQNIDNIIISEPEGFDYVLNVTDVSCIGLSDGQAEIFIDGSQSSYTYLWSTGETTSSVSGLSAGSYTVDVIDSTGCVKTINVSVKEPTPIIISPDITDVSCFSGLDGEINVSVTGGSGSYDYLWSNGQTTSRATGLVAGQYSLTVTDKNGCTETITNLIIDEPDPFNLTSSILPISCGGFADGQATVQASNGLAPYTYLWSDGQRTQTATGLSAGTYEVEVTDAKGCSMVLKNIVINPPIEIELNPNITDVGCKGSADGEILLSPSLGVAPYTFSWSTGQTTQNLSNLVAGNYGVTVTDANGCSVYEQYSVNEPEALEVQLITKNEQSCINDPLGSFTILAQGGTAPYSTSIDGINFNNEQFSYSNLIGGKTYEVIVRDDNGCEKTLNLNFKEPVDLDVTLETEYDCDNGIILYAFVDPKYDDEVTYYFNSEVEQTEGFILRAPSGVNQVTVVHKDGCSVTQTIEITTIPELEFSVDSSTVNRLIVDVSGGEYPYTYSINGSEFKQENTFQIKESGLYTIQVKDSNGCIFTKQILGEFVDIVIPDFFTPNGNGDKDFWYPLYVEDYHKIQVNIFDRYNRLLRVFNGINQGWDGNYNGRPMPSGDYWYTISYTQVNGQAKQLIGNFTLYR